MNQLELFTQTHGGLFFFIVLLLIVWTTVWKGLALWKSARLSDKWWFIALLIVNTAGILELLYILIFSKKKTKETQRENTRTE